MDIVVSIANKLNKICEAFEIFGHLRMFV